MFNKNRKGLAIGAAFSLLLSAFSALPSQAAVDVELKLAPVSGVGTTVPVTDEIDLVAFPVTADGYTQIARLAYYVEKADTTSAIAYSATSTTSATANAADSGYTFAAAAATESVIIPTTSEAVVGKQNILSMKVSPADSSSKTVVLYVTAFIDANSNAKFDAADTIMSSRTPVTFLTYADILNSVALTAPFEADTNVYGTGSLSGINTSEMDGELYIAFTQARSESATIESTTSYSVVVSGATYSTISSAAVGDTVSAALVYKLGSDYHYLATKSASVTARATKGVTVSAVASSNIKQVAAGEADARVNSEWSLNAYAWTGSGAVTTSVKVTSLKLKVTVSPALTSTRSITINGVTYTDSAKLPTSSALVQDANGKAVIAVSTVGWENAQSASFTVVGENWSNTMQVQTKVATWAITSDQGNYAAANKGGTVALNFSIKDNWSVLSTLANQRIKLVASGTGFTTQTQTLVPVGGKASTTVTATPDSISGKLTAVATVQTQDATTGNWVDGTANVAVTISVAVTTNSFVVKPKATYSGTISYGAAMSWSEDITVNVGLTGSSVVISSPGLILSSGDGKISGSDSITLRAGVNGAVTFKATSRLAGSYTVSLVADAATASTKIIIAAAAYNSGKTLTFDKTSIVAGQTSTITGTLVDANGNPVETGTTASIAVKWTGLGLPFNLPAAVDTDEDGQFSFQVLVLSTEVGEAAISATYQPASSATDTKNLTFVQKIDVVRADAVATTDQKLTIGTFNGYIAIYAKGYTGQKLSYKVAGKWGVVDSLTAFQRVVRKTGAGYEIAVVLYIDGVKVKTETVTTK